MRMLKWMFIPLILLVSCNQNNVPDIKDLPDPSVFQENCQTACWNNIIIGESDQQEALQILDGDVFSKVRTTDYRNGYQIFQTDHQDDYDVKVFVKDVVTKIQITRFRGLRVQLGDIVDRFGSPTAVSYNYDNAGENGYIDLYYPNEGIVLIASELTGLNIAKASQNKIQLCVTENTVASTVILLEPTALDDIIPILYAPRDITRQEHTAHQAKLTTWAGFGCQNFPIQPVR